MTSQRTVEITDHRDNDRAYLVASDDGTFWIEVDEPATGTLAGVQMTPADVENIRDWAAEVVPYRHVTSFEIGLAAVVAVACTTFIITGDLGVVWKASAVVAILTLLLDFAGSRR